MKNFRLKSGLSSAALTALVIAAVVLVNVLVSAITDKMPLKIDLTKEQIYEFSNQTTSIVKNINKEVKIYALYPENADSRMITYAKEYLSKYSRLNKKIEVTYIDPYTNPTFAKKYEKTGETINAGSLIIECGDKVKVITIDSLYTQNSYTGSTSIDMEKKMTMALASVTGQSGDSKIYFTEGHEEQPYDGMKTALEGEGYTCGGLNISLGGIAEDAAMLVITAPQRDFTADEISALDAYMDKGGKLLYISALGSAGLEKLESYLSEWGIKPNGDFVVENDTSRAYASKSGIPIPAPELEEHDITKNIISGGLVFMAPNTGSITLSESNIRYASVKPLLTTSEKSYGKINLASSTLAKEDGDLEGPLTVAAISEMQDESGAKIAVLGSYYAMDSSFLEESGYANGDFLLNTAAYLTDKANPLDIRAKVISASSLTMNQTQVTITYIIIQWLIPIIIIAAGLIVWLKRRYL